MSSCNIHIHWGKMWNSDCQEMGRTVGRGWRISIECCKVSVGEADADLEKVDDANDKTRQYLGS